MRVRIRDETLRLEMLAMKPRERAAYIEKAISFYKQLNNGDLVKGLSQLLEREKPNNEEKATTNPVTGFMKRFGV